MQSMSIFIELHLRIPESSLKCWSRRHIDHAGPFMEQLFSYFEKKTSYVSSVSISIFVALSVGMCFAGTNKVEGNMS